MKYIYILFYIQFFQELLRLFGASRSVSGGERLEHGCERSEQKCSTMEFVLSLCLPTILEQVYQ